METEQLYTKFRAIVEAIPGFTFIFDDNLIIQDVFMPESMQLFHSMKELIGMSGQNIYTPEVCELFLENIQGCLVDGNLREIEYPVYLKDINLYYQARIVPYKDNKVLALIQDISDRVRRIDEMIEARKREEANQMKSAFLANMSHEIRTPLNAIVGFSEILIDEEDKEAKKEFIEIIRSNSDLLLQLINDILDLSRIESGKTEILPQQTEIRGMLNEIAEVYQLKIQQGIQLKYTPPSQKIFTYTDPYRIKQILYNFLSNAIKHTDQGTITLQLEIENNNMLIFSVKDTGAGIADEQMPVIFNRFEKLNNYTQGTGLGLTISKNLAERLGGEIYATSVLGEGSTFFFKLPIRKTIEEVNAINQQNKINNLSKPTRKKILIIEPIDTDYKLIQAALDKDFQLIRATTTEDAISFYSIQHPDLVLINTSISSINSMEVISIIREKSPNCPIISLTTHGNYLDQEFAIKAGVNDIVSKPFSASKLRDAVVAYI